MSVQLLSRAFTMEEFHRMAQAGIPTEDDRVELWVENVTLLW